MHGSFECGTDRRRIFTWILVAGLLSYACCSTASLVARDRRATRTDSGRFGGQSFEELWKKRTVEFGAGVGSGGSWQMANPFRRSGGEGEGVGDFPLHVAATLMDSAFIEAGFEYYTRELGLDASEATEFREAYEERYDPADYLLVWCEVRTRWAENYLDPGRWIIFLEDDRGAQCETERVLEEPHTIGRVVPARDGESRPGQKQMGPDVRERAWMLSFRRYDVHNAPIVRADTRFLKLVFLLSEDNKIRSEGTWELKE